MTEKEKKRAQDRAAKLKPKPVLLPSGSWHCGVMVAGERYSVTAPTPEEAHARALAIKEGLMQKHRDPARITVGEAIDRYIESKDAVLSPATVAGYRRVRKNALQGLMNVPLAVLTQEQVQRAVNDMARSKSPKSVRNAHGLLNAAVTAYRPDLILRTTLPQKRRYDIAIPSRDDVGRIIAACEGTENELPILLAVWLGLRMSEILGLKYGDMDGDTLHIRRAKVDEGVKTTKTYSSQRDLPLPGRIKGLIEQRKGKGEYLVNVSRRALYCRFQVVCTRAGVQHYRFHDLRHINASIMLALGVPNKYAQERMGHATDNMLRTIYQHTMSDQQKETARMVDNFFEDFLHTDLQTTN